MLKDYWKKSMMKETVASQNSLYHTGQILVKMLKVQSCELYMMHSQVKTAEVYHWMTIWRQAYTSKLSIRARFKPIVWCGDVQKAFCQIWIWKEDKKEDSSQIEVLWFTRFLFGLVQPRFLFKGIVDEHRTSYTVQYTAEVAEIKDDLDVDDLITADENFEQVASLILFRMGHFEAAHGWLRPKRPPP